METFLALTLSGSLLILLLLLLRRILGNRFSSTVYYYAWLIVLFRFLLPLPGMLSLRTGEEASPAAAAAVPYTVPELSSRSGRVSGAEAGTQSAASAPEAEKTGNAAPQAPVVKKAVQINWKSPKLWFAVWAAGAGISFLLYAAAYFRFVGKLRRALKEPAEEELRLYGRFPSRKPKLYRCSATKTPMMIGVLHPMIILPEYDFDEEKLSNILRHELMHYRRKDTLYKWFAVLVYAIQWFNPLSYLMRNEISRACELSCDEMLLRSMNRAEKQSYGNTLLNMAASSALPAGVVATTFSTEKKNLKERLEQIMNYKKNRFRVLMSVLVLVLMSVCVTAAGPAASATRASVVRLDDNIIHVSTVDELLSAIAPDTVIELAEGEYDLSAASSYGRESDNPFYVWREAYDGSLLELQNVEHLTIRGAGMGRTIISTVPRYADVMAFSGCKDILISDLTAGHTEEPGFCAGGVLSFVTCSDVVIDSCGLYGCGTIGVEINDCVNLTVTASHIYECSYGAIYCNFSRDIRVEDCDVYGHGNRAGMGSAMSLFNISYSDGFAVSNSRIYDNITQYILNSQYSRNTVFVTNEIRDNTVESTAFYFEQYGALVDGCAFRNNILRGGWNYGTGIFAYDVEGNLLSGEDFENMTPRQIDPGTAVPAIQYTPAMEVPAGGSITVATVDEFLGAIGPDRTIVLTGEVFDLSTASAYGGTGGEYYYWKGSYDGPELVIHDLSGLTIRAAASDPADTTLAAIPRYANVLNFRDCESIQLIGFTAGHTKEPGSCSGGVLYFEGCNDVRVDNCRLYGCGILGLDVSRCTSMTFMRTEIYECSQGAGQFFQTDGIVFTNCDIHDVPSPALVFYECGDKLWNENPIFGMDGYYDVDPYGDLIAFSYEDELYPRMAYAQVLPDDTAAVPTPQPAA